MILRNMQKNDSRYFQQQTPEGQPRNDPKKHVETIEYVQRIWRDQTKVNGEES